jgi:hypothetical protein
MFEKYLFPTMQIVDDAFQSFLAQIKHLCWLIVIELTLYTKNNEYCLFSVTRLHLSNVGA